MARDTPQPPASSTDIRFTRLPVEPSPNEMALALQEAVDEYQRTDDPGYLDADQLQLPGLEGYESLQPQESQVSPMTLLDRASVVDQIQGQDEQRLFDRLTRAGPDPPSLKWLPWVLIDFVIIGVRALGTASTSGGEARGFTFRVRRNTLSIGRTLFTVIAVVASIYWGVHLVFDPGSVISVITGTLNDWVGFAWEFWVGLPPTVRAGIFVTGLGGSGVLAIWRRPKKRS